MFFGVKGSAPGSWNTMVTMSFPICLFLRSCNKRIKIKWKMSFGKMTIKHVQRYSSYHDKKRVNMYRILQSFNLSDSWSLSLSSSASSCGLNSWKKNHKCFIPVVDYWGSMAKGWTHETWFLVHGTAYTQNVHQWSHLSIKSFRCQESSGNWVPGQHALDSTACQYQWSEIEYDLRNSRSLKKLTFPTYSVLYIFVRDYHHRVMCSHISPSWTIWVQVKSTI